jgi:mannose-6-phosphate isomerase-like protein (cupin superfamily)
MTATLENPITRERIVVHAITPDVLRVEERVPVDMIPPPVHVHLHQRERFEILQGQATVRLGSDEHVLRTGMSIVADPRTPHTWWNSGDAELQMLTEFTPPGNMLSFFETYCGFAQQGRADDNGAPPFLQIAASCTYWDMYLAKPPVPLQKALFGLLRPLARLRGYRPRYDRFEIAIPGRTVA